MLLAEESGSKIVEALHELNVQTVISIPKVGPFDFSITNAVIYLWVGAVIVFFLFFWAARKAKNEPDGLQTLAEILIGFATGHLCGQLGEKGRKYYYLILTIFTYIMVTNLIGLIPKPEALKPYTRTST
jgi:F-type H+-transporting ATPase subunit a